MFKYLQNRKMHHGRLNTQKRFDPADSHQQGSAIVEGPGGNDCMIKKLNKNKELT